MNYGGSLKKIIMFLYIFAYLPLFGYNKFTMPIEIAKGSPKLQSDIIKLEQKAIYNEKFTKEDKDFLTLLFESIALGANFRSSTRPASLLMKHYLSCSGKNYKIKPDIFIENDKILTQMDTMLHIFFDDYLHNKDKKMYIIKNFKMQDESSPASEYALHKGEITLLVNNISKSEISITWRFENPWCFPAYYKDSLKKTIGNWSSFAISTFENNIYIDYGLIEYLTHLGLAKTFIVYGEYTELYSSKKYFKLSINNFEDGNYNNAIKYIKRAIIIEPNNPNYIFFLANYYRFISDIEKSLATFNNYLLLNPNNAEAYFIMGLIYKRNDIQKAINNFDKAISLNCNYDEAYYEKGLVLSNNKKPILAYESIVKAASLGNKKARKWVDTYDDVVD